MRKYAITVLAILSTKVLLAQTALTVQDTRATPTTPASYNRSIESHFKATAVLGLSVGEYQTVLGLRGWSDDTGGAAHELAFGDDSKIYLRSGFGSTGWGGWRSLLISNEDGNFGIGTTSPTAKLEVGSGGDFDQLSLIKNTLEGNKGAGIVFKNVVNDGSITEIGGLQVKLLHGGTGLVASSLSFYTKYNAAKVEALTINPQGDLGIGTTTPREKLSVNGNIRAKEVKVEATNWPDYVFEEGYKVGKLDELESYIKKNKHLPEMPSAKEVEENGIQLGEMNKLLLKKVEELTLHLIEKEKEIKKMQTLQERVEKLEKILIIKK